MVCTAVWPFFPHMYMIFGLLVSMYRKSPSALVQVFTHNPPRDFHGLHDRIDMGELGCVRCPSLMCGKQEKLSFLSSGAS